MSFFSVFFKTLGLLLGITTFIILLNILSYFLHQDDQKYNFIKGNKESKNIIAILNLNGPIVNNFNTFFSNNIISYIDPKVINKQLLSLSKINPDILIIKINSPGGTVTASASLEKIINKFKMENNLEIYFHSNEVLASGGYWVATSGDKIFASYGSIIGSIGVSGPSWYYYNEPTAISNGLIGQSIETNKGIEIFNQNAGNSKDLYNPFRKPSDEELKHLQNIIEKIYNDFVVKVSNSRRIEVNTLVNEIGALIYSSTQAKENFLIDEVLNYDELITKIVKERKYEDYKIIELKNNGNFINKFISNYLHLYFLENTCNKLNSNFVSVLPLFLFNC